MDTNKLAELKLEALNEISQRLAEISGTLTRLADRAETPPISAEQGMSFVEKAKRATALRQALAAEAEAAK